MLPSSFSHTPRVYAGVRFDVHRVELAGSDGHKHVRDLVVHPGSVLIVPVIDAEHLVLSSDCGFCRQGVPRPIAFYKAAALAQGANIVRRELGAEVTPVKAAEPAFQIDT